MRRAYAFTRPVVNVYLTRERDRRRRRELAWVLLTALPVGLSGLIYVWLHYQLLVTGYNIPRLERELEHRLEVERGLSLEASSLAAPDRVEAVAVERLGMEVPTASEIMFVEQLR